MKRRIAASALILAGWCTSTFAQQPAANPQPKTTPVRCLAFSRDGRSLAVAFNGSEALVVWDVASRKPVYSAHEKVPIRSLAYSPVAELIAVSAGSSTKLLDPKIDRVVRELDGNQGPLRDVSFSPDGRQLVTAGGDRTVKLWDLATGEVVQTFAGPKGSVIGAAFSPDGKWLAAGCGNADGVYLWSLEKPTAQPRKIDFPARRDYPGNPGRGADVPRVTFTPDSRLFAAADWEQGRISIIDIASGKSAHTFTSMSGWKCVAISPDGKWLAAAPNYDRPLRLVRFEQSSGEEQDRQIATLIETFHDDDYPKREAATEQLAALGPMTVEQLRAQLDSPDAEMRVRCRRLIERIADLARAKPLVGHEAEPNWVAFSPDGKLLASGDAAGVVKLWTIPDGQEAATLLPDGQATEPPHERRGNG
jgi:WD40 repeat protein